MKLRLKTTKATWTVSALLSTSLTVLAASSQNLTYQGRISRPDGSAINSGNLTFTISIYSPAPSHCLLYSERQTISMDGSAGMFSLSVGVGSRLDGGTHSFNKAFVNNSTLTGLSCSSGNSYTSAATDDREMVVSFNDAGTLISLSPMKINSVPFALQAHEINGWGINNLVKISSIGSPTTFTLTEMANAKSLSSASCTTNEVLKWSGSAWVCAADATGGAPVDASYVAKGAVQFLTDASTSGINVSGGVVSVNTGTGANQIVKLDGSAKLPAVDGSALTSLTPGNLSAAVPINKGGTGQITAILGFNALSPITAKGDLITSNGTNNVALPLGSNGYVLTADSAQATGLKWAPIPASGTVTSVTSANADISVATGTTTPVLTLNSGTGANQIVKLTAAGKYPAIDGSLITNIDAGNISAGVLPITRGGTGNTTFGNSGVIVSNVTGTALQSLNCTSGKVISFDVSGYAVCGSAAGATGFVNGGNSFAGAATLGTNDNFALNFETNNTTQMSIASTGKVGIGTTSPSTLLQVAGSTSIASATAATAVANQDSPVFSLSGNYWNGVASAADNWNMQAKYGSGANPYSEFVFSKGTGTSGYSSFKFDNANVTTYGYDDSLAMLVINDASYATPRYPAMGVQNYTGSSGAGGFPIMSLRNARGEGSTPLATSTGTILGSIQGQSYDGTSFNAVTTIQFLTTQLHSGTGHGTAITFQTTANNATSETERLRIDHDGKIGIGTSTPAHKLHVIGTAGLSTGTAWTNTSDVRLKDIDGDYEYGLNEILRLNTVRFHYKKHNPLGLPSDHPMTGFIAQEVKRVIPEAVITRPDGFLELNVDPIHWATVNAVQDLHGICKKTESQLQETKGELADLKREIASLRQELEKLKPRRD